MNFDRRFSIARLSGQVSQGQNKRLCEPWLFSVVLGLPEDTLECLSRFLYKESECEILSDWELRTVLKTQVPSVCRLGEGGAAMDREEGGDAFVFLYIVHN